MHRWQAQLLAEMSQAWAVYSQTSIQDFPLVSGVSSHMLSQIVSFEGEPEMSFKINSPEEAEIAKQGLILLHTPQHSPLHSQCSLSSDLHILLWHDQADMGTYRMMKRG